MINDVKNDILRQAEQTLESKLTPQVRANYDKIVVAGMKVALNKGPDGILATLRNSKDPITDIVKGAINIVGMLGMQSRGTMPIQAAVPATMSLIIHALDFADKAGIVKVGAQELARAGHLFGNLVTQRMGVTPDMIKTAAGNIEKIAKDPANMEKMRRHAGFVKDPAASTPTELPTNEPEAAQ